MELNIDGMNEKFFGLVAYTYFPFLSLLSTTLLTWHLLNASNIYFLKRFHTYLHLSALFVYQCWLYKMSFISNTFSKETTARQQKPLKTRKSLQMWAQMQLSVDSSFYCLWIPWRLIKALSLFKYLQYAIVNHTSLISKLKSINFALLHIVFPFNLHSLSRLYEFSQY